MARKFDKDGWPKDGLIVPNPEEFLHGTWVKPGPYAIEKIGYDPDEDPKSSLEEDLAIANAVHEIAGNYHCGTQCCLVGWMGAAFGGPLDPLMSHLMPMSKAHREFAIEFLHAAQYDLQDPDEMSDEELLDCCSDTFEGFNYNDETGLSGEKARQYWIEAGEACGYDLSAFKGKRRGPQQA